VNVFDGIVEGFRKRSGEMTFFDRLDDLRGRMIRAALALTLGTAAGFVLAVRYDLLGFFVDPVTPYLGGQKLRYLNPVDPFYVTFQIALCIGIVVTLPYLLRQAWLLIEPLLLPDEKRFMLPTVFGGVALFFTGVLFCYYLTLPLVLRFTMGFQTESLEQSIVIGEYFAMVIRLLGAFGIAFELPLVVIVGTFLGVVTPEFLAAKRRHAIAIVMILSAIVTPPEVGSMLLLTIPVLVLYEVSIVLSRLMVARRVATLAVSEP